MLKHLYDISKTLDSTNSLLYYKIKKKFDNHLFVDLAQDGGISIEEFTDRVYNDIVNSGMLTEKIVLLDSWEYRENSLFLITKKLVENKIYSPENIHVFIMTFPHVEYVEKIKKYCNLYHLNFWFIRTFTKNLHSTVMPKVKNFICLNHRPTYTRMLLVDRLCQKGYKDSVSWSGSTYKTDDNMDVNIEDFLEGQRQFLYGKENARLKYKDNWIFDNFSISNDTFANSNSHTINSPIYSAAINIISETFIDTSVESFDWLLPEINGNNSSVFTSEKTIKALLAGQIFLIQGTCGTLDYLKTMGFKTFGDYIDESYDNESNWIKRTELIISETDRLMKMNDEEWNEFFKNVTPILDHNRVNLTNLIATEKIIVKL